MFWASSEFKGIRFAKIWNNFRKLQKNFKYMIYLELTGSLTPAQFMTGAGGSKIGDVGTPIFKQFLLTLQMILFSARFLQLFNITSTNFLFLNCIIHILQAHMFFQYANETKTLPIPNLLDLKNYNRHSMTSLGEAMIKGSKSSSIASIFFEKSKKKKIKIAPDQILSRFGILLQPIIYFIAAFVSLFAFPPTPTVLTNGSTSKGTTPKPPAKSKEAKYKNWM